MIFKEIISEEREKKHIDEISKALVEAINDSKFTINVIIGDLVDDSHLLDCFINNIRINGREFYEVDKSLLDLPLLQIKDVLSFAGVSLNDLIQRKKDELQKWEEEMAEELKSYKNGKKEWKKN